MNADVLELSAPQRISVLHVTECLEGGVLQAVARYVDLASASGIDSTVVGRVRSADRQAECQCPTHIELGLFRLIMRYRAVRRTLRPDVIHIHSTKAAIFARLMPTGGAKIVYSPHCFAFNIRGKARLVRIGVVWVERILAKRTSAYAVLTPYEAESARRVGGVRIPVAITPNVPVEPQRNLQDLPAARDVDSDLRIISIGRYADQKNPPLAHQVVSGLSEQGVDYAYTWIGSADDPNEATLFPVTGWLSQEQVIDHIQSAHILLHSAAWEGFPLVILDAISLGLPVVAHNLPEYAGILIDGLYDDAQGGQLAIKELSSATKRKELIARQRATLQQFIDANPVSNLPDLYHKICGGSPYA